jgi:hypothetical protein
MGVVASEGHYRAVFIVRLDRDPGGQLTGVLERVRTGEKVRIDSLTDVGLRLAEMLAREEADSIGES